MEKKYILVLIMALILVSMSNPLLKLIIEKGEYIGLTHPEAISFCNVLFAGNICAGLVPLFVTSPRTIYREVADSPLKIKSLLVLSSILLFIYPTLIYFILSITTISHYVIISQIDVVFYAILAIIINKTKTNTMQVVGYFLIVIAVFSVLLIKNHGVISYVDFLILCSALTGSVLDIINKKITDIYSLSTVISITNLLSAAGFFVFAVENYGLDHFETLFYGDLWIAMFFYAGLTIAFAGFLWLKALQCLPPKIIVNLTLLTPFLSVFFACFVLKEFPSMIELTVLFIIAAGLVISNLNTGIMRRWVTTSVA